MRASTPTNKPFAPNLIAAALCAVLAVAYAGSFGELIFGGPLEAFVGRAVLAALITSLVVLPMLAWRSSFDFCLGGPDSNPSAILAFALAAIAQEVSSSGNATPQVLAATALMFVFLTAAGCGIILYILGALRWGRYVRYIPHPVVGGFLAGSGYLLITGSWKMLTGSPFSLSGLDAINQVPALAWVTVLVVAATLLVLTRLIKHYLVVPCILFAAIVAFHAARAASGLDLAAARQAGLLLAPLKIGDWSHAANFPYAEVRWDILLHHAKDFAAIAIIAVIAILLNVTSLELATGAEGDADQELKTVGLANVLIGLGGGLIALNYFQRSMVSLEAGANSRWAGYCCALMIFATMLFAPWAIGWLPKPVLTGFILYLGISFLVTWAYEPRHETPWSDYLILLAIIGTIAWFGMVPGVGLGLVAACVSFVFAFSRTPSVRNEFSLKNRRSNVERPARQNELLLENGEALRGFELQGFLFFGTTAQVLDKVRAASGRMRLVLLDFRLVNGIDGSSTVALKKLKAHCSENGITLIFTGMAAAVESRLRRGAVGLDDPALRTFPDVDRGLEWCEESVLGGARSDAVAGIAREEGFDAEDVSYLEGHFERVKVAPGALLLRQGDPGDSLIIIQRGRVSVYMRAADEARPAAQTVRLRTYTQGTVVGEIGFYTGARRNADIVADEETLALKFGAGQVELLEKDKPALAAKLQRFIARSLSQRLAVADAEIRELI